MRNLLLTIVILFCASPVFSDDRRASLHGILVREKDAFVSDGTGLYRAMFADEKWMLLKLPDGMPTTGRFAIAPPDAKAIYYFVHEDDTLNAGLYLSEDDGQTWKRVCDRRDFISMLLLRSGELAAVARKLVSDDRGTYKRSECLISADGGRTWKAPALLAGNHSEDVFPDPLAPAMPVFYGFAFRPFVWTTWLDPPAAAQDSPPVSLDRCEWHDFVFHTPDWPRGLGGEAYWSEAFKYPRTRYEKETRATYFTAKYVNLVALAEKLAKGRRPAAAK